MIVRFHILLRLVCHEIPPSFWFGLDSLDSEDSDRGAKSSCCASLRGLNCRGNKVDDGLRSEMYYEHFSSTVS